MGSIYRVPIRIEEGETIRSSFSPVQSSTGDGFREAINNRRDKKRSVVIRLWGIGRNLCRSAVKFGFEYNFGRSWEGSTVSGLTKDDTCSEKFQIKMK